MHALTDLSSLIKYYTLLYETNRRPTFQLLLTYEDSYTEPRTSSNFIKLTCNMYYKIHEFRSKNLWH